MKKTILSCLMVLLLLTFVSDADAWRGRGRHYHHGGHGDWMLPCLLGGIGGIFAGAVLSEAARKNEAPPPAPPPRCDRGWEYVPGYYSGNTWIPPH